MKLKAIILIIAFLTLAACQEKAERQVNVSNPNFKPEMLFEIDGYRIYRFDDGTKETIYFVISGPATTEWETTENKTTEKHNVFKAREK